MMPQRRRYAVVEGNHSDFRATSIRVAPLSDRRQRPVAHLQFRAKTLKIGIVLAVLAATGLIQAATSAQAQDAAPARSSTLETLVGCRSIADASARLACYDAAASALDAAEQSGDVIVVDRVEVRETQQRLFGFEIPALPILSRGDRPETVDSVTSTLTQASQRGTGTWVFTLEDGSVWRQTDAQSVRITPRVGDTATVRRAAMGSFMLSLGRGRSIRVARVQ
jgi:hypothetical protein